MLNHFFFSSRRRHTRSYGDWSSDVCSSDLKSFLASNVWPKKILPRASSTSPRPRQSIPAIMKRFTTRSEERRVGKECSYRRSQYDQNEKEGDADAPSI